MGYAVRDTHIAEPSRMRVPAAALNDKAFAKTLAAKLDRDEARAAADRADARQRHRLSHRGRSRPPRGLDHQLALFGVRHRDLHREDRHHVQQPRLGLRARSRSSEHARPESSGRCTPSSRRWRCATAAATRPSASWARTTSRWATCRWCSTCSTTAWTSRARSTRRARSSRANATVVERGMPAATDRGPQGARAHDRDRAVALGRRAGDPHRLAARRADRRLRAAQGWLRAWLLEPKRVHSDFSLSFCNLSTVAR